MANTFQRATKNLAFEDGESKVETGVGQVPLYFKNVGLFSDNYILQQLDRSKDASILKSWDTEGLGEFSALYEWMLSTWDDKHQLFEEMKESQLEEEWIKPILQRLGWEYIVQPDVTRHGKRQIPDYALFTDARAKTRAMGASDLGLFDNAQLVADAKAMKIDLDGTAQDNTNPSFQIVQYMSYTNKDWGILTNGKYWRLYSLKSKSRYRTYFEVNVEKFLAGNKREDARFRFFFNFFRKDAFTPLNSAGQCFIDLVFSEGEQYAFDVERELKTRAFDVVERIANGFAKRAPKSTDEELRVVYEHSLYYLFRLMFILNCEAKGLLSVGRQSDYFQHSLRALCLRLKEDVETNKKWSSSIQRSYHHVTDLFELLSDGDKNIGIHGFGNEVFESGKKSFYTANGISDDIQNDVLMHLAFHYDKKQKTWSFIDYHRLSPDHLGSVFEGLLEFKLQKNKDELQLVNSSGERKATGSYYTPDHIVDYIVKETVGPLTDGKSAKQLLELKIIDPSMGSGHFLLGVVRFLEDKILERMNKGDESISIPASNVRWAVLHSCAYGVDINPLAVELAKFSLWMSSAQSGMQLEPLEDQLKRGDSLMPWPFSEEFDAVVGNPPYVNAVILSANDAYKEQVKKRFVSAEGAFDISSLFFEAAKAHSPKCRIGFILPNKLLSAKGAAGMRKFLCNSPVTHVHQIDDLSTVPVFKEASVYPVIIIVGSEPVKSVKVRSHEKQFEANKKFVNRKPTKDADAFLRELVGSSSAVSSASGTRLEEVCEMLGAATVSEAYEFKKAVSEDNGKERLKFIVSGNVLSFGTTWGYESTQYIKAAYNGPYLDLGHKVVSEKRRKQYRSEKIILANMTTVLKATYDSGSIAPGKSTTMILSSKIPMKCLAAYLNSAVATAHYKEKFDSLKMNGGALRIGPPQLKELMIPAALVNDRKAQRELSSLYDNLSMETAALLKAKKVPVKEIRQALEGRPTSLTEIKKLRDDLDSLCEGLWKAAVRKAA